MSQMPLASDTGSQKKFERRLSPRYSVSASTKCQFALRVEADFDLVRVKDISLDGIGMILGHPVEAGALLVVGLKKENFSKIVLVEVRHSTRVDGNLCHVGGVLLTPLTYEEMSTLVM